MLLLDGVRYELWTPSGANAEDDFEQVVGKHAEEIFGEGAKYFDLKHKLASRSGTGSIPDGYVITLGNKPEVQIIEFELASHTQQHIVNQVVNIISGIENPGTQQRICNAIEDEINRDEIFVTKIAKATKPFAIHRFLSDSFSNALPTINIIIDKNWPALEEAISKITPPPRIIEFQTFRRVGAEAVHAHLFEPLYKASVPVVPKPPVEIPPPNGDNSFDVNLTPASIKNGYITIPRAKWNLFPNSRTTVELETDVGVIDTVFNVRSGHSEWFGKGLTKFFKAHPELRGGDIVRLTQIFANKKYRLKIVK